MFGIIVVFIFICAALSCGALFNSDHLLIWASLLNLHAERFIDIVFNGWGYYVILNGLIFVATFFSIFSGINYIIKINKLVKKSASQY
jgi:phosphatidylglycerophosphate synthase